MRLPYAPSTPPPSASQAIKNIYSRIAARRHPRPLIPLDLTLLHSPPVADGYNAFIGALRTETIVPASLLELAISRVAILTDAVYEWNIHAALALKAGVSPESLGVVWRAPKGEIPAGQGEGQKQQPKVDERVAEGEGQTLGEQGQVEALEGLLSKKEAALLQYTDQVTVDVKVQDATFLELRKHFDDREVLELTTVVAGYNAVSRILVPLDVGENNAKKMKTVAELEEEVNGKGK